MQKIKITKDKNGMYHTRVFASPDSDGKRLSKRITGYTEREVRRQAEDFIDEMKRQPKAFKMTLREATAKYLDYQKNKKDPLSPATMRSYCGIARNHFASLQDTPIIDITEDMVQEEIYKLEFKVKAKTIHNIINFYVPCIRHSRRGFRPELDLPVIKKPITKVPDVEVLKSEINKIKNIRLRVPVLLASYCGMRRSEIAALNLAQDIEFDKEVLFGDSAHRVCIIHITKAMVKDENNKYVIKDTKSDSGERDLFAPAWLGEILKNTINDKKYKPYAPHQITNAFGEFSEKHNIGCSFHGLRHFYASFMKALNIPDNYAMLLMGHSTDNMLQRYQEIMSDKQLEVNRDLLVFLEKNAPNPQ